MKTVKILFFFVACAILFISCEKEIDLDLKESDQLFVVEGILCDSLGDNFVKLSKTRVYSNNGPIEKISNASVQIKDDVGGVFNLYEVAYKPGYYTDSNLIGIAGRTYELNVNINGELITATSLMHPRVEIDSLIFRPVSYVYNEYDDEEQYYNAICHFTDPGNAINFYRMKVFYVSYIDSTIIHWSQYDGYTSWSDDIINGTSTGLPVSEDVICAEGEKVKVQLLSVDETNFRYFQAVKTSQGGDIPGNPITNLSGEKAVGYFGAYAKSEVIAVAGD